jgi:beta-glucosidase
MKVNLMRTHTPQFHRFFISVVLLISGAARIGWPQSSAMPALAASRHGPRLQDAIITWKVDSLLARMSLEEKLGQLNQLSRNWDKEMGEEIRSLLRKGLIGSFLNVAGAEETKKLQQLAVQASRLRIPLIFGLDVIHGFRTTFPIPLAEASTWDPAAVQQAARIAAIEASAAGIHWTFAPMVDIARDPRWGRIAEGAGEDPYLGATMAAARVRGFQGNDWRDVTSILACAKHFAAYGSAEAGRDYNTVEVSERTLREIYCRRSKPPLMRRRKLHVLV